MKVFISNRKNLFKLQILSLWKKKATSEYNKRHFYHWVETDHFPNILLKDKTYFRYTDDDALLIYIYKTILPDIKKKLKNIEHAIKCSYETETNCSVMFLYMLNRTNFLKINVYRKSTQKWSHKILLTP